MKRLVFALASLFAIASVSKLQSVTPITAFQPGTYLGYGSWLADDGSNGDYSSLTTVTTNGWQTTQNRDGQLYFYESVLNIDANGFFTAQVTDNSDPNNPQNYTGYGNCGSTQCQLTVTLNNGTLQKSILINTSNNTVQIFAAIYYDDGTPDVQWEGLSALLPANATAEEMSALKDALKSVVPIEGFEPGNYAGAGSWLADDGTSGDFLSFLNMDYYGWTVAKFSLGNLYIHETWLLIDDNGFFTAYITDASDPANPVYYSGNGNCGSSQCLITVPLNNGILQKTIVFSADASSIYCYGAIYYNDGTPNKQFEGSSVILP